MDISNLTGKMLIAVPGLEDPHFSQTVTLICEHSKDGAFGLIINRILMNSFLPLLNAFDIKSSRIDLPVYYGGPVKPEQGYVIYTPFDDKYLSLKVFQDIAVTSSKEILQDIAQGRIPDRFLFALGFAGWGPNQIEEELLMDSWLVAPFNYNILFDVPAKDKWKAAAHSIGIDLNRLIQRSGNA